VPYYPNAGVGLDRLPRTHQTQGFANAGNPHMPVTTVGTPAALQKYLEMVNAYLATKPPDERILTINSWKTNGQREARFSMAGGREWSTAKR